jgi:rare lipoprotein A
MRRTLSFVACAGAVLAGCGTLSNNEGGYYKDDGPPDRVPRNLAQLPDARPRWEPLHRYANRPYEVLGKIYTPFTELRPYKQLGVASWYGKRFHGKRTSSGERYDMYAMTAAHPLLVIPSYARVTNLDNGKSVVVRINDRGPFHDGRLIDLSYAAAYKLDYVGRGSARVEVEAIIPKGLSLAPQVGPVLHAAGQQPEG